MDKCSICGKEQKSYDDLIKSNNILICRNCIETAHNIFGETASEIKSLTQPIELETVEELPKTPLEIKKALDEYVIGQEQAKKVLSVAVYNHFKKIQHKNPDIKLEKSNILLMGPSGSGKTVLANTIAEIFHVPIVISDATSITEAGYIGGNVENILVRLYQNANKDLELVKKGIVFIDEIDKLAKDPSASRGKQDVGGEGVQQALLKMIEGTEVSFLPEGKNSPEEITVDTSNILFICSGAFQDLPSIIKDRLKEKKKTMNFVQEIEENESVHHDELSEYFEYFNNEDLLDFGLIQEFIGRLPVKTYLTKLDQEQLLNILTVPKNAIISQYKELFKIDEVELDFEEDCLLSIVNMCIDNETGARGLRTVLEDLMLDLMFDISSYKHKKITITAKYFDNKIEDNLIIEETDTFIQNIENEDIDVLNEENNEPKSKSN